MPFHWSLSPAGFDPPVLVHAVPVSYRGAGLTNSDNGDGSSADDCNSGRGSDNGNSRRGLISTAICTPMMPAVDASTAPGC
jgi:hypothetical protein